MPEYYRRTNTVVRFIVLLEKMWCFGCYVLGFRQHAIRQCGLVELLMVAFYLIVPLVLV